MNMKLMLRIAVVAIALTALVAGAADKASPGGGAAAPAADLFEDTVLARGKGVEVKRSQLESSFIAYKANLAARGQSLPEDQRGLREAQLLDRLVITQILVNRATAADQLKAKEMADKFTAETKKLGGSEDAFYRQLKAMGLSAQEYDKRVNEQALSETVVDRELKAGITIPDAQVEEFYKTGTDALVKVMQEQLERLAKDPDTSAGQLTAVKEQIDRLRKSNLAQLEQPEKVRVIHLFLALRNRDSDEPLPEDLKKTKRQLMEKILARARAGEDFAALVQQYSEDQGLKETKGEYTFSRNDPFTQEFKAAAFSLSTNQLSEIVATRFGYHLIKLLEKIPAKKIEFDKVAKDIREHLVQQALQQQMPAYFARLKREAGVEVLDAKYRLSAPAPTEPLKPAGP